MDEQRRIGAGAVELDRAAAVDEIVNRERGAADDVEGRAGVDHQPGGRIGAVGRHLDRVQNLDFLGRRRRCAAEPTWAAAPRPAGACRPNDHGQRPGRPRREVDLVGVVGFDPSGKLMVKGLPLSSNSCGIGLGNSNGGGWRRAAAIVVVIQVRRVERPEQLLQHLLLERVLRIRHRLGRHQRRLADTLRGDVSDEAGLRHRHENDGIAVGVALDDAVGIGQVHVPHAGDAGADIGHDGEAVGVVGGGRRDRRGCVGLLLHHAGGAANAHGRDRRRDLHVALVGDLAGDEGEGAFDQGEQRAVGIAVGVERIVVERHARIGDQVERGAVGKRDAARRAGAGRHHVALEHGVADMERDAYAVAHHGDVADDFFDFADRVGRRGGLRLRIVSRHRRSGEQIDRVG